MSRARLPPAASRVAGLLGGSAGVLREGSEAEDRALVDLLVEWRLAAEASASLPEGHGLSRAATRSLALERERVRVAAEKRAITTRVVGAALGDIGVRGMFLKGEAVVRLTHGDASRRPMADVDVLVAPEDVGRAAAALVARGLERSRHDTPLHVVLLHPRPGEARPTAVELHSDALEPPHPFELDLAAIRARATPDAETGLHVPRLDDVLALSSVHLVFHENDARKTLLTLRDLAHLVRAGARPPASGDIAAIVAATLARAAAWAGAPASSTGAPTGSVGAVRPRSWSRRVALAAALGELDGGVVDPGAARWRVIGRRLGCALWWPRVPERVRALASLARRATPEAVGRAARGLRHG